MADLPRRPGPSCRLAALQLLAMLPASTPTASADEPARQNDPIYIDRASGEILVDGELDDAAWQDAPVVETWWETNVADNQEPDVQNRAWLLYDDRYLYAAFEFPDPEPEKIRAPFGDHDDTPQYTDYGGLILDTNGDAKTAQMFLANARGVRYDALTSDATGEDSSPDFHWQAAGRIHAGGWSLEIRVPLSSIRYSGTNWRVLMYRNHPRDRRYQMFSSRLPRDVSCFICNVRPIEGLKDLPTGSHYVVAPVVTAAQSSMPSGGLGSSLDRGDVDFEPSLDLKWLPNPQTSLDATVNPDFSQVESDEGQITANERFALFFPEKRPFFLEGIDLFATPIQAVYTRTFTSPRWGARTTGTFGPNAYTLLVGEDEGGGSTIIPGPSSSSFAEQDFGSTVAIGRWRRNVGERSFVSLLLTDRESEGGSYNRVFGPDFQWRPDDVNNVTGQFLISESETPDRPDLADEWDGRRLSGYAGKLWWSHNTGREDWFVQYEDRNEEFRADSGFSPKVGFRSGYAEFGYTLRPERGLPADGFLSRLRTFVWQSYSTTQAGQILSRESVVGAGMDGKLNSFLQLRYHYGDLEAGGRLFSQERVNFIADLKPSQRFSQLLLEGWVGKFPDFANAREGDGGSLRMSATLRPTDHLAATLTAQRNWLDVNDDFDSLGLGSGRLFTVDLARLRAVYTFNSRSWLRVIVDASETERDPSLYLADLAGGVDDESGEVASSLVFAYKLNWQSVLFLGAGEFRALDEFGRYQTAGEQLFLKISYAFQR